jgi:hypothetical protein
VTLAAFVAAPEEEGDYQWCYDRNIPEEEGGGTIEECFATKDFCKQHLKAQPKESIETNCRKEPALS